MQISLCYCHRAHFTSKLSKHVYHKIAFHFVNFPIFPKSYWLWGVYTGLQDEQTPIPNHSKSLPLSPERRSTMPHWPMTHRIDRHWAGRFTFVLINSRYWWKKQKIHKWNWWTENFPCDTSVFSCMLRNSKILCNTSWQGEKKKNWNTFVFSSYYCFLSSSFPSPLPVHPHLYPFTSSLHTSVCLIPPLCSTSLYIKKESEYLCLFLFNYCFLSSSSPYPSSPPPHLPFSIIP